jgi:hypothetical protein
MLKMNSAKDLALSILMNNARFFLPYAQDRLRLLRMRVPTSFSAACTAAASVTRKVISQGGTERLAQDRAFRQIGSESAFQDSPNRGDEPRRKNALEGLNWRQSGVYS